MTGGLKCSRRGRHPDQTLHCVVTVGGVLSNNKESTRCAALCPHHQKDRRDRLWSPTGVDWVALNFVHQSFGYAGDRTDPNTASATPWWQKSRNLKRRPDRHDPAAVRWGDGGRGDLGVEMPAEEFL